MATRTDEPMGQSAAGLVRRRGHYLAGIVLAGLVGLAPAARAADFTYSGNGQAVGGGFPGAWSDPSNWAGGTAPTGSVGTLVFPRSPGCSGRQIQGCLTTDDVSGLSVHALKLEAGYVVGGVRGDPLTLGSGGLTVQDNSLDRGHPAFAPAITLGAPQTWSMVGSHRGAGLQVASVSGAGEPLAIAFSNACRGRLRVFCDPLLEIAADAEVGAITATGPGAIQLVGAPFSLNGTDGNPVAISGGAGLEIDARSSTGSLTFTHGFLNLSGGHTSNQAASVSGNGSVSLDSKSGVTVFINRAGTSPGKDYAQLRAHGPVSLGRAVLILSGPLTGRYCARLHRGDVDTLITTTGALSGTFRAFNPITRAIYKVRNGTTLPVNCAPAAETWSFSHAPRVRIHYTHHSVTATVVRAVRKR